MIRSFLDRYSGSFGAASLKSHACLMMTRHPRPWYSLPALAWSPPQNVQNSEDDRLPFQPCRIFEWTAVAFVLKEVFWTCDFLGSGSKDWTAHRISLCNSAEPGPGGTFIQWNGFSKMRVIGSASVCLMYAKLRSSFAITVRAVARYRKAWFQVFMAPTKFSFYLFLVI